MDLNNFRMSKSKINQYLVCPRAFRFSYIDKEDKLPPEKGSPLQIGIDVHQIFEDYYKDPRAKEITEPYDLSMFEILCEYEGYRDYTKFIENFIDFNQTLIETNGVPGYIPVDVEVKLYDPDLNFVGIIDAVYDTPDGIVILDYKTGKTKAITEYRTELALYKVLYERQANCEVNYVGIYFPRNNDLRMAKILKPDEEPEGKEMVLTLEDEFTALATLDEVRERIAKNHFPPQPGFLCNWCSYGKERGTGICTYEGMSDL